MKVVIDVDHAFSWAHGGVQVLVERLLSILPSLGIEAEPLRWWDSSQKGDVLHTLYKPGAVERIAKLKGYKIVSLINLDYMASNGRLELIAKQAFTHAFKSVFTNYALDLGWFYGDICDAVVHASQFEAELGSRIFGVNPAKTHVILPGVDSQYFEQIAEVNSKSDYLVSVSTIHPRKNSLLLAQLAHEIEVPIVFVGKPYQQDEYFDRFYSLVDDKYVFYKDFVGETEKIQILKCAKGFVLLSRIESGCLAVLEALAVGLPIFLPDLEWARSVYDGHARFGNLKRSGALRRQLRAFYDSPSWNGPGFRVPSWNDVARKYADVYKKVVGERA